MGQETHLLRLNPLLPPTKWRQVFFPVFPSICPPGIPDSLLQGPGVLRVSKDKNSSTELLKQESQGSGRSYQPLAHAGKNTKASPFLLLRGQSDVFQQTCVPFSYSPLQTEASFLFSALGQLRFCLRTYHQVCYQ